MAKDRRFDKLWFSDSKEKLWWGGKPPSDGVIKKLMEKFIRRYEKELKRLAKKKWERF